MGKGWELVTWKDGDKKVRGLGRMLGGCPDKKNMRKEATNMSLLEHMVLHGTSKVDA
jgi:hypothetical protein